MKQKDMFILKEQCGKEKRKDMRSGNTRVICHSFWDNAGNSIVFVKSWSSIITCQRFHTYCHRDNNVTNLNLKLYTLYYKHYLPKTNSIKKKIRCKVIKIHAGYIPEKVPTGH